MGQFIDFNMPLVIIYTFIVKAMHTCAINYLETCSAIQTRLACMKQSNHTTSIQTTIHVSTNSLSSASCRWWWEFRRPCAFLQQVSAPPWVWPWQPPPWVWAEPSSRTLPRSSVLRWLGLPSWLWNSWLAVTVSQQALWQVPLWSGFSKRYPPRKVDVETVRIIHGTFNY